MKKVIAKKQCEIHKKSSLDVIFKKCIVRFHVVSHRIASIVKTACKTATLKKTENWFSDKFSLNAGQKYYRMLSL